jgi:trehalose/maltose hydrolase-like predicted phosphorylase
MGEDMKPERTTMRDWTLAYDSFVPEHERLREVLTSTGNGYFCTRGAAEWAEVDDVHYPGTYAHGVYNRETTIMDARPVLNEDLVNLPNWLLLKLRIEDEEPISLGNVELLSYRQELDVRNATTRRTLRFRDRAGRETALASRRFVSMADRHVAAIEWTVTPENWTGNVAVITALDARVANQGVARYRELKEDIVFGKRHAFLGHQLGLQTAENGGLGVEKGPPGASLIGFELGGHVEYIVALICCRR